MSHLLGQLLGSQGRFVEQMFVNLERATNQQAYDVDIVGRILTANNYKLRQLGFQPGTVEAVELRPVLERYFTELEGRFDQRFTTDQALAQAINQALQGVAVLELSSIVRDQLDAHQVDFAERIAKAQRGYFQTSPLCVNLESEAFDQRLIPTVKLQSASTKLRSCLLTALMIKERVRQSNQLAIMLASDNRPTHLQNWLAQGDNFSWTLASYPVTSEAVEQNLTNSESELYRQLQDAQPELAKQLTEFKLENFVNQLIKDDFFADSYGLGLVGEQLVSFNIFDQISATNQQLYTTVYNQLITQYLQNPNLTKQILQQLDRYLKTAS